MRKKRLLIWTVIAGAAAAAASLAPPTSAPDPAVAFQSAQQSKKEPIPSSRFAALPEREPIGNRRGEAFAARSWAPPAAPVPATPVVTAPPAPPAMPYRVAGHVVHGERAQVVLAKGDAVLTVEEGDALDGGYRVESIGSERVTLLYVPLGVRESLPVTSTLAAERHATPSSAGGPKSLPPQAAQLRWEGPPQVRAGDTFSVTLKVTSSQPVRASPLQLSFDAKLLEPVNVRAGGFFADGMFSYRVNPSGSIFVGASGKGAVAADAEFLVVTFKPIRAGATAELTLSSLILQSVAGGAIVHDQPGAFRTAIVQ